MNPAAAAALASWSVSPGGTALLLLAALVYLRGWRRLARLRPTQFPRGRLAAFWSGLAVVGVAAASPLDVFGGLLLSAHMLQHLLLLAAAPPLLLLGAPEMPLLLGLPRSVVREVLGPWLAAPAVRRLGRALTHPVSGLSALTLAMWGWHVPAAYELALRSPAWHGVEHACFLAAGVLFWWPVIRPWPSRPALSPGLRPLYLLAGDLAEHGAGGGADVLGPRALPVLRGGSEALRPDGAGRSVARRRSDVGAGLARLPRSGGGPHVSHAGARARRAHGARLAAASSPGPVRPSPGSASRPAPARPLRPPEPPGRDARSRGPRDRRRFLRSADRRVEPRRGAALDVRARAARRRAALRGQPLLHGLSLHAAPRSSASASASRRARGRSS